MLTALLKPAHINGRINHRDDVAEMIVINKVTKDINHEKDDYCCCFRCDCCSDYV
ncbi:hypothetical protein KAM546c_18860 [Enterobacter roggenkampii]|nr:hypothetical protein KAM546c_18860 [Enterobacter roggenkampii]